MTAYLYRCRPPGIGCQPDGLDWEHTTTWMPARVHPNPPRHLVGMHFLGRAVYPAPLEFDQIWHYDLVPEDPREWAEYIFWREEAPWLREDYVSQTVEDLQKAFECHRDVKALAALILKEQPQTAS